MMNYIKRYMALLLVAVSIVGSLKDISVVNAETYQTSEALNLKNDNIPEDAVEFEGHFYKVYNNCETWEEAKTYCDGLDGHLATITSQMENEFLFKYITSKGIRSAYFGLSDVGREGNWKWVTGEEINYTNWHSNEPNAESTNEDYAMFYWKFTAGTWNDGTFGETAANFICEWDSDISFEKIEVSFESTGYPGTSLATYSEKMFLGSSYNYNHYLANLTLLLELSSWTTNAGKYWGDTANTVSDIVAKRTQNISSAYEQMGFEKIEYFNYDDPLSDTSDKAAYSIAQKKDVCGTTLVSVVVRGSGYGGEWASNFNVGNNNSSHHTGFFNAASEVFHSALSYVENIDGPVKFWVTGYSRGAAVANIAAARLDFNARYTNKYTTEDVYAYTFATPQGVNANGTLDPKSDLYNNIFNIVYVADPVPTVAPTAWKYGRFGVTLRVGKNVSDAVYNQVSGKLTAYNNKYIDAKEHLKYESVVSALMKIITDTFPTSKSSYKLQQVIQDVLEYSNCRKLNEKNEWSQIDINDYYLQMIDRYGDEFWVQYQMASSLVKNNWEMQKLMKLKLAKENEDLIVFALTLCGVHGLEYSDMIGMLTKIFSNPSIGELAVAMTVINETGGGVITGHESAMYLSWMNQQEKNTFGYLPSSKDYSPKNKGTSVVSVSCPVNVCVYDENGTEVLNITDHEMQTADIPAYIDGETVYIFFAPDTEENYDIVIEAYDDGMMDYTVTETDMDSNPVRRVNYYDVELTEGQEFSGNIDTTVTGKNGQYDLIVDGNKNEKITASEEITEDFYLNLGVKTVGAGTVTGAGKYIIGTNVYLTAEPDEGETFVGWYDNSKLLSKELSYSYCLKESKRLTAKFTGKSKNVSMVRLGGATRYETALEIADAYKEQLGVAKFENVVVATGKGFADALSGSYLATLKNAPILLTNGKNVSTIKNYIKENLKTGGTVYLLGGDDVVPESMEKDLNKFLVKRLAGATRYETNIEILKEAGVKDEAILVCTGKSYADCLSASAAGMPILLVKEKLGSVQKKYLETLESNEFYIIGGTSAVSLEVEEAIGAYGGCRRIGGATRYETSAMVAETFIDNPNVAVLAYSKNFPDGLCGGPLAAELNAPLILTMTNNESVACSYASENGIYGGYVLGSSELISDKSAKKIFDIRESDKLPNQKPVGGFEWADGFLHAFYINGWAEDPDTPDNPVEVRVYVDDKYVMSLVANTDCYDWGGCGCGQDHGFVEEISYPVTEQREYKISIYAVDTQSGEEVLIGEREETIYVDTTEPSVTNIAISDVSKTGYTITCDVTDNTGVKRVRFFTWKVEEGMDFDGGAYPNNWETGSEYLGKIDGDQVTYRVNVPQNTSEKAQLYRTDIYAEDVYGCTKYVPVAASVGGSVFTPLATVTYNGHIYALYDIPLEICAYTVPWSYAKTYAESIGGYLATITSEDEWQAMKPLMEVAKSDVWLGATDEINIGKWKWITGEDFSYSAWENGYPKLNEDEKDEQYYLTADPDTMKWSHEMNPLWWNGDNFIVEFEGDYAF